MKRRLRLIVFDLDDTLVDGEAIMELIKVSKVEKIASKILDKLNIIEEIYDYQLTDQITSSLRRMPLDTTI